MNTPENLTLSVIIPVYNERSTLREIVNRVIATGLADEIIIVDDGSDDGTRLILAELEGIECIQVIYRNINGGKGTALREGLAAACGDLLIVQDADLEYDPADYGRMLTPIHRGEADVVYGSRFLGELDRRFLFWNRIANRLLTTLTNLLYGSRLTDMETCYKLFRRELLDGLNLKAKAFEFEPEFTAKTLKCGIKIVEVPIHFYPRMYKEGKKIRMRDALMAVWTLFKYRFTGEHR